MDILDWFWEMPPVTRAYFTAATAATVLCALDVITPYHLYLNSRQVARGEYWRLVTNFLYFGQFGLDFVFHMYFMIRYCRSLEESSFRGRPADFLWMLIVGGTLLLAASPFLIVMFFGSSLTFMLVYLWSRRNPGMQISLLGLLAFQAPYLPWVLAAFSALLGHDVTSDALGICAGHAYYYLADVWPALAAARGWRWSRPMSTPWLLRALFGQPPPEGTPGEPAIIVRNAVPAIQPQQQQPGLAAPGGADL